MTSARADLKKKDTADVVLPFLSQTKAFFLQARTAFERDSRWGEVEQETCSSCADRTFELFLQDNSGEKDM